MKESQPVDDVSAIKVYASIAILEPSHLIAK